MAGMFTSSHLSFSIRCLLRSLVGEFHEGDFGNSICFFFLDSNGWTMKYELYKFLGLLLLLRS
jgi:hypothetical protein